MSAETNDFSKNDELGFVRLLQSHDKAAFEKLYDKYSPVLYGIILKIVKREDFAENILQDAFVKIWKNIDSYNTDKGRLFTWLLNLARNAAIDFTRSKMFKQTLVGQPMENYAHIEKMHHDTFEVTHIGIKEKVEMLSAEYQEAIYVVYYLGYSHSEAAEELKIPLGTLKSRIRIGIRELKKVM